MIILEIQLLPIKKKKKEFLQTLSALVENALSMDGCMEANLFSDFINKGEYVFRLMWEGPHQLQGYLESDSLKALMGMKNLMLSKPQITVQNADEKIAVEGVHDNAFLKLKAAKK
jgi:quinol monooxygenase YgiN